MRNVLNAFKLPDLRRKILFTLAMLVVYRFAAHIPVPGVNADALRQLFESNQLLGLLDMFSGGAMSSFSVVAMGVYPYITASIIMQLLVPLIPPLDRLSKEGEAGQAKINQYTHIMTVPMAALQAISQITVFSRGALPVIENFNLFSAETFVPSFATIITLAAGTMFAVWLGELITEQGVGNGVSIIIFGGIVSRIPQRVAQDLRTNIPGLIAFAVIGVITVAAIVFIYEGQRRIPVQYGKRVRGTKIYGGQSTHIPMKVNSAGMIPLIFASSILILPGVVAQYFQYADSQVVASIAQGIVNVFDTEKVFYWLVYFIMVVGFTYFYTETIFQQQNMPENLQKHGGFIPGIRPGARTAQYLNRVLRRITLAGALFLGGVAVLPFFASTLTPMQTMIITSTGLLIVVGVVIDTMKQLEAQLLMRHYEGFLR
ncbi:MAG: preprotein translocase subunit SecY [Chloroflexi bacterium B3_Chlor]|nr:MAG: preprotein translocase subunit SecY [Chloroflexi bacterium B3_Chlor]